MRLLRISFSIVLLAIMSFSILPKEIIHDFYRHTDTAEDEYCLKGFLHIENIHHHCEMLNYASFPFEGKATITDFRDLPVVLPLSNTGAYIFVNSGRYNLSPFRAPPVA